MARSIWKGSISFGLLRKDPWAEYFSVKQSLTVAMMKEVMRRD